MSLYYIKSENLLEVFIAKNRVLIKFFFFFKVSSFRRIALLGVLLKGLVLRATHFFLTTQARCSAG